MKTNGGLTVQVRDAWCGWRAAEAEVTDLEDVHWFQPPGAPRSIVHAYVKCTNVRGYLPHDCSATRKPHRLFVCILKRSVAPSVHAGLARRADNRRNGSVSEQAARGKLPAGAPREGTARAVPWLLFASGGGLALAVILSWRRGSRVAVASAGAVCRTASTREAGAIAA